MTGGLELFQNLQRVGLLGGVHPAEKHNLTGVQIGLERSDRNVFS
jgi:hypothetical protein